MIFLDEHSKSIPGKLAMFLGLFLGSLLGTLSAGNFSGSFLNAGGETLQGDIYRQVSIFLCCMLYSFRFAIALFVFIQRKISWRESFIVTVLFFMMFYYFSSAAAGLMEPFGAIDILGITIFITGSFVNLLADYQRFSWKKNPKNKGKLYTFGLFRYSMHPNYFGDALAYFGLALITHNIVCISISIGMFIYFVTYEIPRLDRHLSKRYKEFESYSRTTKKFIPFVY